MKAVKVQYTVKPEYVEENKENIRKVMDALKSNPIDGMQYSSYTDEDNPGTFIHINMAKDGDTMAKLTDVPEFTTFRMALKASEPVAPPKSTNLSLVGAAFEL
ncbi:hypothetical protein [Reichenbachiella sp.]|uniref:hypothetical protein n=1 Tax=Reichenbachiella sp. TaxID=2184521 RepID=UPI003297A27A